MSELTWSRRLKFGVVAGVAGGLASSVLLWLLVEPAIRRAVLVEDTGERAHRAGVTGHEHGELVSRMQQQIGGTIAVIVVAVLLGLVFAVTYAKVSHRVPGSTDLGKSLSLAGLAVVVHGIVPGIAVPANPPGVGSPDNVDQRTLTYLAVIMLGCVFVRGLFALVKTMTSWRVAPELRFLVTTATVVAGAVIVLAVPHLDERIPRAMRADLLWDFRIGSLAELVCMWVVIGVVHGILMHRARNTATSAGRSPVFTAAPRN